MGATELFPRPLLKGVGPAGGVTFAPRPLIEVALAFDVAVLKAVGPGADLP